MRNKKNYIILILAILFVVFVSILFINGRIKINPVFAAEYEMHGVDVSHYQGTIDWDRLAEQDLDFAFIKATEGSSHLDECFYDNWKAAENTNLYVGAYHFFSFDSDGEKQAELFINTVGSLEGKLAPVIDVEFYDDKAGVPPKKEEVAAQLGEMLSVLEEHYQIKPIIYTTYTIYSKYIKGEFEEYPLWIRNVYYPPIGTLGDAWSFWQYTDTAVLEGYVGDEKYIDRNVFKGTEEELEMLLVPKDEFLPESMENDSNFTTEIEQNKSEEILLLEDLFTYEHYINYFEGENYYIITGINKQYEENFQEYMSKIANESGNGSFWTLLPGDANGIPVKKIGEEAFQNLTIRGIIFADNIEVIGDRAFQNSDVTELQLPDQLKEIGEEAFENCDLTSVRFPDKAVTIEQRAFAENDKLWKVLFPNIESVIGEDSFENCDTDFLICYGDNSEKNENLVRKFAVDHGIDFKEIYLSKEPIVRYPEELIILQPEVKGFFYGMDGDFEDENFWDFEMCEDAPNFGFIDWHLPGCSSWCGSMGFEQEAEATSELASSDGKYEAANVLRQNRDGAWAEGAEGVGIGESITYRQSCKYSILNEFESISKEDRNPQIDGFMRYSEICIVNGYAKNQTVWEENGRVKTLLMLIEGKPYAYLQLEDTILPQYFTLPEDDIKVLSGEMIEFEFVIEDVYPGMRYEDACITGIVMEFTGRYAH